VKGVVDVAYGEGAATAAAAGFSGWSSDHTLFERVLTRELESDAYQPGAFFRRELPPLLDLLGSLPVVFDTLVVDGYVDLAEGRPGLGAHLRAALGGDVAVVGVAKSPFASATHAVEVYRGDSARPLYVTAAGLSVEDAADAVRRMAGPHRVPDILRRVDHLARGLEPPVDPTAARHVYKIVDRATWTSLDRDEPWLGTPLDLRDGFIHLSHADQVEGTLAKHFTGRDDVLLVTLDLEAQPDLPIRWEVSRGGALFPHLYGALVPRVAARVRALRVAPDGSYAVAE